MKMLLQVALLMLDLQLGECGQQALQAAGAGQGSEEVPGLELALCCSRAASLVGDDTGFWLLSRCSLLYNFCIHGRLNFGHAQELRGLDAYSRTVVVFVLIIKTRVHISLL